LFYPSFLYLIDLKFLFDKDNIYKVRYILNNSLSKKIKKAGSLAVIALEVL